MALTPQQRLFCDNYISSGSIKRAAEIAGYESKVPYHILSNKDVKEYLKDKRRRLSNQVGLDFGWKVKRLALIVDGVLGAAADDPTVIDLQYANVAINAISELNRMQGHHADKPMININLNDDLHIKRLREVTAELLEQKRKEVEYLNEPEGDK